MRKREPFSKSLMKYLEAGTDTKLMNSLIRLEITNQIMNCRNFLCSCKRAALKDDGVIDEDEKRILKKLMKATERYAKELDKLSREK